MELDLTTSYPRSVHDRLFGVAMLPRAIDKGKGAAGGKLGEYNYNCPMDQAVFGFLGIDKDALLDVIKGAKSDAEIEAYLKPIVEKKAPAELEEWSNAFVTRTPDNPESQAYFNELRSAVAPDRTDVTAWADVLDLDEKRNVPKRTPVNA
jgi:hypothetical protein